MQFKLEHFAVNWVDGMKISKDHFIDTNNYITDLIRDSNSSNINSYNYGLLPTSENLKNSLEINISKDNKSYFSITLNRCYAITYGGFKINYDSKNKTPLTATKEIKERSTDLDIFYIILSANPYQRVPIGTPSLEEAPPRHPYTDVTYTLDIIHSTEINVNNFESYHLLIGKIIHKDGHINTQENYIPPCSSINSHKALFEHYISIKKSIQHLQITSLAIIKKIQDRNKPSNLSKNIFTLCQNILSFTSANFYSFSNELSEKEPIKVVGHIASLAHSQYNSLQCFSENEREEILKYIFEWTDITPNEYEDLLFSSSTIPYDHNDINKSIEAALYYLTITERIWSKMNTLEFIGQRKENMVITHEVIHSKEEQPKKRWSILD